MTDEQNIPEAPIKVVGEDVLKEIKLSWAGKIFFAGAAAYVSGKAMQNIKLPIKLRGTPQQIKAIVDAVVNSKEFQREINKPGASIDNVIDKLRLRNLSKERFRQITNLPWPL